MGIYTQIMHAVACRGGANGRRPRTSMARGAPKEWNYKIL